MIAAVPEPHGDLVHYNSLKCKQTADNNVNKTGICYLSNIAENLLSKEIPALITTVFLQEILPSETLNEIVIW